MESFSSAVLGTVTALTAEVRAANGLTEARLQRIEKAQETLMHAVQNLMQPRMEPIYMSVAQAAKRYSLSPPTMYEIIAMPESPPTQKVGTKRLLPIREYDQFFADQFSDNG